MADQLAIVKDDGSIRPIDTLGTAAATAGAGIVAGTDNVIVDLAPEKLLGRGSSGGTGDPEAITIGSGLTMTGTTLTSSGGAGVSDGDKGDITVSSSGAVWTIDNDAVTYAKIQNVTTTDRLLGRDTAAAGNIEQIQVVGGIEFTGSQEIQVGAFTGDVTKTAGGTALTIANDAVTYAKMQNVAAASKLLGRGSAGGAGDPEEITVGSGLTMTATTLSASGAGLSDTDYGDITVSGTGTVMTIDAGVVTLAKMADIATNSLIGRDTASTGVPENILLNSTLEMDGAGNLQRAALTGDVTASAGSNTTAIASLALSKLATQGSHTFVANATGSTAVPTAISVTTATSELNAMVGDSGAGGTKGLVPAPASGDAAALKFLKADATWAVPTVATPSGTLVKVTYIFQGTTSFTKQSATNKLIIHGWGGGAGGGGCATAATSGAAAGGGGGGAYARVEITANISGSLACVVGAKGAGGTAGANNGSVGSDTTFADSTSANVLTAKGGAGGTADSVAGAPQVGGTGGIGGLASTSVGDLKCAGATGTTGIRLGNAHALAGFGGNGINGGGGRGRTGTNAGNAATGYAAGGGGASIISGGASQAGGDGADGLIMVEEWS